MNDAEFDRLYQQCLQRARAEGAGRPGSLAEIAAGSLNHYLNGQRYEETPRGQEQLRQRACDLVEERLRELGL